MHYYQYISTVDGIDKKFRKETSNSIKLVDSFTFEILEDNNICSGSSWFWGAEVIPFEQAVKEMIAIKNNTKRLFAFNLKSIF